MQTPFTCLPCWPVDRSPFRNPPSPFPARHGLAAGVSTSPAVPAQASPFNRRRRSKNTSQPRAASRSTRRYTTRRAHANPPNPPPGARVCLPASKRGWLVWAAPTGDIRMLLCSLQPTCLSLSFLLPFFGFVHAPPSTRQASLQPHTHLRAHSHTHTLDEIAPCKCLCTFIRPSFPYPCSSLLPRHIKKEKDRATVGDGSHCGSLNTLVGLLPAPPGVGVA